MMKLTSLDKAQAINNDFGHVAAAGGVLELGEVNYRGAIAEIGAGQEVARLFFEALGSSRTIVKTMSAYGKGCSDAIYGKVSSYISEERLENMFAHDYRLLLTRALANDEKPTAQKLRYFTFANTVDINRDGWAAVRVQANGCALMDATHDAIEYRVHFEILAKDKAAKIKIVGALGINLIHAAILTASVKSLSNESLVSALMDNIETTDLRIDSVKASKLQILVDASSKDHTEVSTEIVEKDAFGAESRDMCIALVKTSTVRCAAFKIHAAAATTSYTAINKGTYLVLTRSACDVDGLPLEIEMLDCAKDALQNHLSLDQDDISTAIHMPILSILSPDTDMANQFVYIDRQNEPPNEKKQREELIQGTKTDEIAARIERIIKAKSIALLSEFNATSELIKFLRTKTRLNFGANSMLCKEIACVFRADQLVMFLINIEEQFKDRDSLEIIGSIIRRRTRFYIYPCAYTRIFESKTLYGTPIEKAFEPSELRKHSKDKTHRVTIAHLKEGLKEQYSSLLAYMSAANCIYDLNPTTNDFIDFPLRPQIAA